MIRLTEIHKAYDPHASGPVLRDANLAIESGEFVAILGKSGSGKTTLLNIIGGLDRDYAGTAVVDGAELKKMKDRELSRFRNRTIAFVFQTFNLLPHLSCAENVAYPAYFGDAVPRREIGARAREAMERVGIAHKSGAYPNTLSGGERQRVAIARAIFQRPKILLADEPTGNLDSASGQHVMNLFLELNRKDGVTVMLVTHDEHLAALAHRIVRIADGRIVGEEKTA
jgi:ABC-type lipoprotein export system ATPase subunit